MLNLLQENASVLPAIYWFSVDARDVSTRLSIIRTKLRTDCKLKRLSEIPCLDLFLELLSAFRIVYLQVFCFHSKHSLSSFMEGRQPYTVADIRETASKVEPFHHFGSVLASKCAIARFIYLSIGFRAGSVVKRRRFALLARLHDWQPAHAAVELWLLA